MFYLLDTIQSYSGNVNIFKIFSESVRFWLLRGWQVTLASGFFENPNPFGTGLSEGTTSCILKWQTWLYPTHECQMASPYFVQQSI